MKCKPIAVVRWIILLLMVCFITFCRYNSSWAEMYALKVYPVISALLSGFSSIFPFSLEEVLAVIVLVWIILYPFWSRRNKTSWKGIIGREIEVLVWIYIWFYWAWGINYFRYDIYTRLQATPVEYKESEFLSFLQTYTDSLNNSYLVNKEINEDVLEEKVKSFYSNLPSSSGLMHPKRFQSPKYFTFTPLYSGVGVLGSMGPFFAEAQLNADLLPAQLPFTYAHEFSHLLGITNEAEANYWAYRACIESDSPQMKYSGYWGLFPYVVINAKSLLNKEKYNEWINTVRPEVIADFNAKQRYWQERYSPWVGKVQDFMYNLFLKGNRIPSGKKNYAEVINILLSVNL